MTARALSAREAPHFAWAREGAAARVMAALEAARPGASRFVGGCVRDSLAGEAPKDVDIATQLRPEAAQALLKAAGLEVAPTGLAHGTITAIADRVGVEVTSLRADVSTDGRRATIAYTDDWQVDARRRDFTVNALFLSADLTLFDYVGAAADLAARRVRFIGAAEARIREDYLRILRFFRFSARIADAFDGEGLGACAALKDGVANLSAERVGEEMFKILTLARAPFAVEAMAHSGVLAVVWPNEADIETFARLKSAWLEAPAPLGLAALWGEAGEGLAMRLRLSNAAADRRKAALRAAETIRPDMDVKQARAVHYRAGAQAFADGLALAAARAGKAPAPVLAALAAAAPPHFDLSGRDIIAAGEPPGPRVAKILGAVEERWIAEDFPDIARLHALLGIVVRQRTDLC